MIQLSDLKVQVTSTHTPFAHDSEEVMVEKCVGESCKNWDLGLYYEPLPFYRALSTRSASPPAPCHGPSLCYSILTCRWWPTVSGNKQQKCRESILLRERTQKTAFPIFRQKGEEGDRLTREGKPSGKSCSLSSHY